MGREDLVLPEGLIALRRALAVLFVLLVCAGCTTGVDAQVERPNVIVFMTDDQNVEEMRVMPNVKRLIADEGVTFDNSFASFPVCCPSRATFLTGQYARNHGVMSNQLPLGSFYKLDGSNTLPVWLQKAGYDTMHVGKYLNGYGTRNAREVPPGWTEWHGAITNGYFDYSMNENGRVRRYGSAPEDYEARVVTRIATRLLEGRRAGSKPFFMSVAYHAPHAGTPRERDDPALYPSPARDPEFRGRFAAASMPRSPSFNEADVSDKPRWNRRPRLGAKFADALERVYRQELESLLSVDKGVGEIMRVLDRRGLLDNTLVIFTSDNGVFHGDHRYGVSKTLAYEPSLRVPLVIRGGGFPRDRRTQALAVNVDLAPTIVDVAGATPERRMDGRSLLDVFRRGVDRWRHDFIVEGTAAPRSGVPPYVGLRTERYLYIEWGAGSHVGELYDLRRDPDELDNRYDDPRYERVVERLHARYRVLAAQARRNVAAGTTSRTWIVAVVAAGLVVLAVVLRFRRGRSLR